MDTGRADYINNTDNTDAKILQGFRELDFGEQEKIICSLMQSLFAQAEAAFDPRSAEEAIP